MNLYGYEFRREIDLMHHGIQGMKWGIRRYQNQDGSLTKDGQERYSSGKKIRGFDEKAYNSYLQKKKQREIDMKKAYSDIDKARSMPNKTAEDRKRKSEVELDILKKANSANPNNLEADYYSKLAMEVNSKSGDWYDSKPVSNENKHFSREYYSLEKQIRTREKEIYKKYIENGRPNWDKIHLARKADKTISEGKRRLEIIADKLDGVALRDIGFEDTPEARKYMRGVRVYD